MDIKTCRTPRLSQHVKKAAIGVLALLAFSLPTQSVYATGGTQTFYYGTDQAYTGADITYPTGWDGVSDVPAVVYFHGGGFTGGSRTGVGDGLQIGGQYLVDRLRNDLTAHGIAFISADYHVVTNSYPPVTAVAQTPTLVCNNIVNTVTPYGVSFQFLSPVCTVLQATTQQVVTYRTNGYTLKDSMQDGMRLMKYLRDNEATWHIAPNRIIVAGSSAGAGIAQYIALQPNVFDSTVPPVRAAVLAEAQTTYNPDDLNAQAGNFTVDFSGATTVAADSMLNNLTNGLLEQNRAAGVALLNSVSPTNLGLTTATQNGATPVPVAYYNWRYPDSPCSPVTYSTTPAAIGAVANNLGNVASLIFSGGSLQAAVTGLLGTVTAPASAAVSAYEFCLEHNAFFPRYYAQRQGISHSASDPSPIRANGSTGQWIESHHVNDSTYSSGRNRSQQVPYPNDPSYSADPAYNNLYAGMLGYFLWVNSWPY